MASFVDRVVLHVAAGDGGHGVASVRREKFKPLGGPDGGNGGRGGDVDRCTSTRRPTTLLDYHHSPHRRATNGQPGGGDDRNGADGDDLVLPVPEGTVVKDARRRGDRRPGRRRARRYVVARGGRGGLGNKALASPRRKAPGFALLGEPGDALDVVLELKTLADVALDRLPVAPASPASSRCCRRRRPKIADYPFTTLVPNLGVVTAGDERFTVADVPGLIPGAQRGQGPGAGVPAARRALLGAGARDRLRHPRARPRPAERPRRHRGRAVAVRAGRRPWAAGPSPSAPAWSCSTRPTSPRPASWPRWSSPTWRPGAWRSSSSPRSPAPVCAS